MTVALVARPQAAERAATPGKEAPISGESGRVRPPRRGLDDANAVEGADALGGQAGGARAVAEAEPE